MSKHQNKYLRRRPPRMPTIDYSEPYIYSITFCTADRKGIFGDCKSSQIAIDTIMNYAERHDIYLYVFCVMPDHIHIALHPEGEQTVIRYIGDVKGRISYLLHKNGIRGSIWQRGFYDHVLRKSEGLEDLIMYILENPVRKGLVDIYTKYPWSWDRYRIKE